MGKIPLEQKKVVKGRLLEEAARYFAKHGFDGANINEIAISAGFAKGTIYNYFKSKEELFGEVIVEAARRAINRYSTTRGSKSIRDSLKELVLADISVLKEEEDFMKVLVGEAMDPRSKNYNLVISHLAPFLGAIAKVLEEGLARHEIRGDKPIPQLALVFLGLLALLYIRYWTSRGGWPKLDDIPDLLVTLFLDGATANNKISNGMEKEKR